MPSIIISPVDSLPLPKTYEETIFGPYRNYWIPAIAEEIANLKNYEVWRLEQMPMNAIPVKGKFVYKWKPDNNNHLERAKV